MDFDKKVNRLFIVIIGVNVVFGVLLFTPQIIEDLKTVEDVSEEYNITYKEGNDSLSFDYSYADGEVKLAEGDILETELTHFEEVSNEGSGIVGTNETRKMEVGYINDNGEEQYLQDKVNIHYLKDETVKPKFVVDNDLENHVWIHSKNK